MSSKSRLVFRATCVLYACTFFGSFAFAAGFETGRSLAPAVQAYEGVESATDGADAAEAARYRGYVAASYDALIALGMICENGASRQDVVSGVTDFFKTNPEKADSPAFELTYLALITNYPCAEGSGGFKKAHAPGNIEDGHSLAKLASEHTKSIRNQDDADLSMAASFSGYVSGAHDALSIAGIVCTAFGSAEELSDLIATFVRANPGRWDDPGFSLVTDSLIEGGHLCER